MVSIFKKIYVLQVLILISSMLFSSLNVSATPLISSSATAKNGKATLEILSKTSAVGDAKDITLGLKIGLAQGWKTYWRTPGTSGFEMKLDWNGSKNIKNAEILWPFPQRLQTVLGIANGYEGDIVFPLKIHLDHPGKPVVARINISYLICDLTNCVPQNNDLLLTIPAGKAIPTAAAGLIDQFLAKIPKQQVPPNYKIQEAKLIVLHDPPPRIRVVLSNVKSTFTSKNLPSLFVESNTHSFVNDPTVKIEDYGHKAVYTMNVYRDNYKVPTALPQLNDSYLTITFGDQTASYEASVFLPTPPIGFFNLIAMLSIAFVGGIILNFMPCVFPVLSIKVFAFLRQRDVNIRKVRLDFAATIVGIISSFLLVAIILMALRFAGASVGWGFQFQHPTFLIILMVVLTIFAANLFGFFEFHLPVFMSKTSSSLMKFEGLLGNFLEGFLVTLLATPCTAPFVGTAIGFAFTEHAYITILIFATMGTGLALPYILVAIFPNVAKILPKPGAWMLTVKKVMGLLLLITALWLNFVLLAQIGWISSLAVFVLMGLIFATLAVKSRTQPPTRKLIWGAVSLFIVLALISPPFAPQQPSMVAQADKLWHPFKQEQIADFVNKNKVVFVDVTAEWCLTCKTNELLVLKQKQVQDRLSQPDVVAMKADWTNQDPKITHFLKQFNQYGIPFYVVYGCHIPGGLELGQILTSSKVLESIDKAKCT